MVGAGELGQRVVELLGGQGDVMGFLDEDPARQGCCVSGLPVLGHIQQAEAVILQHRVDQVILALPSQAHEHLFPLLGRLSRLPVRLRAVAQPGTSGFLGAPVESLGELRLVEIWTPVIPGWQRAVKRLVDLAVAAMGLVVLAPLLGLVALAIKLEDGGPALYRSRRVGEKGRPLPMLKFRSMVVDATFLPPRSPGEPERGDKHFYKIENDPRVTRVGRFLRRTSIDELPQLWNILMGHMSLVGPRPELPELLEKYQPWHWPRFAVPQGLTGWWQVNGRSDSPVQYVHPEDDLYYVQHYSLWLDLVILWRTVAVVLKGKGAY